MRASVTRPPAPSSPAWRLQRRLTVAHTHKVNLVKIIWSPLVLFLVSLKAFYKYGEWKVREDREGWKWETENGQKSDELE